MHKINQTSLVWLFLAVAIIQTPALGAALQMPTGEVQTENTTNVPKAYASAPYGARDVITEIIEAVGLKPRFEIVKSTKVPNAAAVIMNGKRFVLYNERFLAKVNNAVHTDWAGVSILAHEIGHHLNGHTLDRSGSNPGDELEADEFSGFVLRKLGASLEEAQAAIKIISDERGSHTHPARSPRLAAISTGWKNADAQIVASVEPGKGKRPHTPVVAAAPAEAPVARRASYPQRSVSPIATATESAYLVQLMLDAAPRESIYVTKDMKLVRVSRAGTQVIGSVSKSNSTRFPFVLQSDMFESLLVTDKGHVINQNGDIVGAITTV